MVLADTTKISKLGSSAAIIIPAKVFHDSVFPFHIGSEVLVIIERKKLIIKMPY